ncbi:PREDICTED: uncharacterized protein LOC104598212 [Nelumbo nucifera]|uniref:Uncharacterized protein LOC104598212 n=1 Tax=Nelumbo nucifera TaxID=4432 RepID=A0A1U8AA36_NELNU|nr:PREDICTED: uncharacterized protein LOC104598212 [Nelumbo nucifera]
MDGSDGQRVMNLKYDDWVQLGQIILGWIISSLTESVVIEVVILTTSAEVWKALSTTYSAISRSRALHLKRQLQSIKKGLESIIEYVKRAKVIVDSLATISELVGKENLILCILSTPGTKYESIVTVITNKTDFDFLTINDILRRLLNHEAWLEQHNQPTADNPPSANFVAHGGAMTSYQGEQQTPSDSVAYHTSVGNEVDPTWYPNSGATHHLTPDVDNLQNRSKYMGLDQVTVGNGLCL